MYFLDILAYVSLAAFCFYVSEQLITRNICRVFAVYRKMRPQEKLIFASKFQEGVCALLFSVVAVLLLLFNLFHGHGMEYILAEKVFTYIVTGYFLYHFLRLFDLGTDQHILQIHHLTMVAINGYLILIDSYYLFAIIATTAFLSALVRFNNWFAQYKMTPFKISGKTSAYLHFIFEVLPVFLFWGFFFYYFHKLPEFGLQEYVMIGLVIFISVLCFYWGSLYLVTLYRFQKALRANKMKLNNS